MAHEPGSTIKPVVALPRNPADCWTWLSSVTAGRAMKTVGGKATTAARWMWSQLFGPIPAGMVVFHTCGEKTCINPHHLRCGYQAEANRSAAHVTLTPADVRHLRSIPLGERSTQRTRTEAMQLGVQPAAIRDVWRNSTWRRPRPNNGPRHKRA